jgi:hypothetical protein
MGGIMGTLFLHKSWICIFTDMVEKVLFLGVSFIIRYEHEYGGSQYVFLIFLNYHVIVLGVHCTFYKNSYNIS